MVNRDEGRSSLFLLPLSLVAVNFREATKEQPSGTKSPVVAEATADTPAGITSFNPNKPPIPQGSDMTWRSSLFARRHPVEGGESQQHSASDSLLFLPLIIVSEL